MAREQKLNVEISAEDKASAKITDVAKKVDKTHGRKATVKVDADTSPLMDALEDVDGPIGELAGKANDLAGKFGGKAGVAGGVAAVGVGLLAAADYAADAAIEVGEVAALTGDSVEQASRLNGVWKQAGFDTADLKDVVLQMNGVLRDSPELAEQLGINLDDGKTIGERFTQVVDTLGDGFTESGERAQLASKLFGEEGVRQVSAVQQAFGDLTAAVEEYNGKVYSSEDVREAYQHRQDVAKLKQEWSDAVVTVGQYALKIAKFGENAFLGPARFFESLAGGYNAFDTSATVAELEDAMRAAQMFDRSILASATSFDDVHAMVLQVTGSLTAANIVATEWANANADAAKVATTEMSPAADMIAESIDKARANVDRFGADGVEQMGAVADATDDAVDEVDQLRDTISRLRGELSAERAFLQLSEDLYAAGGNAAITRDEVLGLQDQVLDYIEQIGNVPTEVVTDILALVDEGKYGEALTMLAEIERERDVWVNIRPRVINTGKGTRLRMDEFGNLTSLPTGDDGGIVPGPKGSPQLALLHGGETVLPTHKMPGSDKVAGMLGSRGGLIHIENYVDQSGVGPREFARMLNARLVMGG